MNLDEGRTIGILGSTWRASVTRWGDVRPWDGSTPLVWSIAAEDRWHFPEVESSTRQTSVRGTPVLETRVRIPNGDILQRIWSAAARGGGSAVVIEFINESPSPVAIALSRDDVVSTRTFHYQGGTERPWPSADRGVERPPVVIPLAHRASVRIALPLGGSLTSDDVDTLADWEAVVRGWESIVDGASRLDVPDVADGTNLADAMRARRCEIALDPPVAQWRNDDTAVRWLVAHRELVRMGLADPEVPDVVSALERLIRRIRRRGTDLADLADGVRSGAYLLDLADSRAFEDFGRAVLRAVRHLDSIAAMDPLRVVHELRSRVKVSGELWNDPNIDLVGAAENEIVSWSGTDEVTVFPDDFDSRHLGVNIEAHRLIAGGDRTISLAIRWHGERPAVIWEVEGPPGLLLRSGADAEWTSVESSGEALWRPSTNWQISGRPEDLSQA